MNKKSVVNLVCEWKPETIIALLDVIAWPVVIFVLSSVVLLFCWRLRKSFGKVFSSFSEKRELTKLSLGKSGVTADFSSKQIEKSNENSTIDHVGSSMWASIERIRNEQEDLTTELSIDMHKVITQQVSNIKATNSEKIELLTKDISILQASLRYADINKLLFRSQFNLLNLMADNAEIGTMDYIMEHFNSIRKYNPEAYIGWEWESYMRYLVYKELIRYSDGLYQLTKVGKSYVEFMRRNPYFIDQLSSI